MKSLEEIQKSNRLIIAQTGIDGGQGEIHLGMWKGTVIWSFGGGWEHVSVCPYKKRIVPSWDDMCAIKDIFWNDDECVLQYHPPKSEYVSNVENCLHLWRPISVSMPVPPSIMVGIKDGQRLDEAIKDMRMACM